MSPRDEAKIIIESLNASLPKVLDGQTCVLWMKKKGTHWRQMEWPGWFFEEFGLDVLFKKIGGTPGPTYGRTRFDYQNSFVWDLKIHAIENANGQENLWMVFNDKEAIEKCIKDHGGVGFIIADAKMKFDTDGSFKAWHDQLKGQKSAYVTKKEAQGAWSRVRKKSATVRWYKAVYFSSREDITRGFEDGWLKGFQEGMINSNDNPRRVKIQVKIDDIPPQFIIYKISTEKGL